jgi:hypothetical protein
LMTRIDPVMIEKLIEANQQNWAEISLKSSALRPVR